MEHSVRKREGKIKGKGILCLTVMFCLTSFIIAVPEVVFAQEKYPTKPINFLCGFAAGGVTDIAQRAVADAAGKILGQQIVVVNKPGASSAVQLTFMKNQAPDGYTIGTLVTSGIGAQYTQKVAYDTAKDFTPIIHIVNHNLGLVVRSDSPWKTLKEFIDYAKTNPGKIHFSTSGIAGPSHMVMERLGMKERINWKHVPFDGGAPAVAALLGGHVEACSQTAEWTKHVDAGSLRLLAVYTEKRMKKYPNVPTLMELGYDIISPSFIGIAGPKGLSSQVVETLHGAFKKALEDPDVIRVMEQSNMMINYKNPQQLAKRIVDLNEEIGSLISILGLQKK